MPPRAARYSKVQMSKRRDPQGQPTILRPKPEGPQSLPMMRLTVGGRATVSTNDAADWGEGPQSLPMMRLTVGEKSHLLRQSCRPTLDRMPQHRPMRQTAVSCRDAVSSLVVDGQGRARRYKRTVQPHHLWCLRDDRTQALLALICSPNTSSAHIPTTP